jgi:hypothetical protein
LDGLPTRPNASHKLKTLLDLSTNTPMEQSPEPRENISQFEKLLAALAASGVDFAVAGGIAVILNGYPRLTVDADILVGDSPENLRKMLGCLTNWGEGWARELKVEDFSPQEGCIRVSDVFDLDIFVRMREKSLDYFRPRLRFLESGDARIPYLSAQDLIFLKIGSWREKDKLDVRALQEILSGR